MRFAARFFLSTRTSPLRFAVLAFTAFLSLGALIPSAEAQSGNLCDHGETPDLITGDIGGAGRYGDLQRWGTIGGITAYSFSATACNVGSCWAEWVANTPRHPVIGQNMFRLKDGRFEQLGQSWLKHGFGTEDGTQCGACTASDGQHLGVYCSDLYIAQQNGYAPGLGPKSDVNAYTGTFVVPPTGSGQSGNAIFRRLQVHNTDLDPALNPAARYFAEIQYISPDDAQSGNGGNNASHRRVLVSGSNGVFNIALNGPTVVGEPAIKAWRAIDPSVVITEGNLAGDGTILLAAKATYVGGGRWRYEYAVQNLNASTPPLAVSIPYPPGATVTSTGFHDVDYHSSGTVQSGADWGAILGSDRVIWKAALIGTGEDGPPNTLRWGTLYNFRLEVDAPPGVHDVLLGFTPSRTPFTQSLSLSTLTPSACDADGVCDPGESCTSCAADCAQQGGGPGCCGNDVCEEGETPGACFADCSTPEAAETSCADGWDEDGDGDLDCMDSDCCSSISCDGLDIDGDSLTAACDCDDAVGAAWATPGETRDLTLVPDATDGAWLYWEPPLLPGGTQLQYEVIRSETPVDFVSASICLPNPNPTTAGVPDSTNPVAGRAFFYLVRGKNACPSGVGPLGQSSAGVPHAGMTCP